MIEAISYQNKFKDQGHQCQSLVIRCMDFRFHRQLDQLLDELYSEEGGFGDYDSPGPAGGASKAIVDEASRPVVFSAIDIAKDKHQIKRILIIDHIDCGAYGGSSRFSTPEEEGMFHMGELNKAKDILTTKYPSLEVVTLYQDWDSLKII